MTVSKTATADSVKGRKGAAETIGEGAALQLGELSELLGYSLKRAQLKIFEDFLRCVAPLQLTPAQFSVLLLLGRNSGCNQTEIANTLGILRPNFVAVLDRLESSRSLHADALRQRPPLACADVDRQGPCRAGARQRLVAASTRRGWTIARSGRPPARWRC